MALNHPKEGYFTPMTHEIPVPYRGAAPAPQRRTTLAELSGEPSPSAPGPGNGNNGVSYEQRQAPAPTYFTGVRTAPPPAAPETAAELAALRSENGQLRAQIGDLGSSRKAFQRQLDDMRLRFELASASAAGSAQPALPSLPPGFDADQPMTYGGFMHVANNVFPVMEGGVAAQAFRQNWDITPTEEQSVMSEFGSLLANVREPERTRKIAEIVRTRRAYDAPAAIPVPAAVAPAPPQPITTVPMVEGTTTPYAGEPSTYDPLEQARAEYAAAEQMPVRSSADTRERLARMKRALTTVEDLSGVTEELRRSMGFHYKG